MIDTVVHFLFYLVAGLTLKIGDDLLDESNRPRAAWVPLGVAGLAFGVIMTMSEWDLILMSAIILAVVASGKVNRVQYAIGFVMIGLAILGFGLPTITSASAILITLVVMIIAGFADERGNDWSDSKEREHKIISWFFENRFTLKITVLLLVVPYQQFIFAAVGLWVFDVGYYAASRLTALL